VVHWFTAFVLYVIVWWTVLFAVLPVGTRPVAEADAVTGWRGAPARPLMGRKLLATTLISAALWGILLTVINSGWISFRSGWLALPTN
jgi:predicted secreted protein